MVELHDQTTKRTNWSAYLFGCIAGIVPWVVIALYFFGVGSEDGEGGPPAFVYFILGPLFVFWSRSVFTMLLQYKRVGPRRDYLFSFGERMYVLLSLMAKSALARQVFGDALAGQSGPP